MLPDVVKKTDLMRKALTPGPSGHVLFGYPVVWLMSHAAVSWQSDVLPKFEERVSRETWQTILNAGARKDNARAACDEETADEAQKCLKGRVRGRNSSKNRRNSLCTSIQTRVSGIR